MVKKRVTLKCPKCSTDTVVKFEETATTELIEQMNDKISLQMGYFIAVIAAAWMHACTGALCFFLGAPPFGYFFAFAALSLLPVAKWVWKEVIALRYRLACYEEK